MLVDTEFYKMSDAERTEFIKPLLDSTSPFDLTVYNVLVSVPSSEAEYAHA